MAEKPRAEIIADIEAHITRNGGDFRRWYVGVSDDARESLFTVHGLRRSGDPCIARRAMTSSHAYDVKEYFRTVRGTRASSAEAAVGEVAVYAYLMNDHSKP